MTLLICEAKARVRGSYFEDAARPALDRISGELVPHLGDLDHRDALVGDADRPRLAVKQSRADVYLRRRNSHDCHLCASLGVERMFYLSNLFEHAFCCQYPR